MSETLAGIASSIADGKALTNAWLAQHGHGQATVTYKLRDWLFSRQRYWGEPFPIVFDEDGVAHALPESMLPLELPVPLVLASGAGSEGRRAIGVVIFTGVSFASFITLLVIPVFYLLLAKRTSSPGAVAMKRWVPSGASGSVIVTGASNTGTRP